MKVIGLTGGIGMGKSTVAKILCGFGFPIYSADEAVRDVLKKGGAAVEPVAKLFPQTKKRGGIDRGLLAEAVFGKPEELEKLEKIVHPLIAKAERAFLKKARKDKALAAILEIPLLFETGAEAQCDIVLCVSAPPGVRKSRVMARSGMTEARFRAIVKRQMPHAEACNRADYVIPTGESVAETKKYLRGAFEKLGLLTLTRDAQASRRRARVCRRAGCPCCSL